MSVHCKNRVLALFAGCVLAAPCLAPAQTQVLFRIRELTIDTNNTVRVRVPAGAYYYYILLRGEDPARLTPASMIFGEAWYVFPTDPAPRLTNGAAFYKVARYPVTAPRDHDSDGVPDTYEMLHADAGFDPVTTNGLGLDPDGDGVSNYHEYLAGTDPLRMPLVISTNTSITCNDTNYDYRDIVINGATVTLRCERYFNSLRLTNGAVLTHPAGQYRGISLVVWSNIVVDASSRIDTDGRGYGPGGGFGPATGNSGAGHGGTGGLGTGGKAGAPYGLYQTPTDLGTAGSGSLPGGTIKIDTWGNFRIDGVVTANGLEAASGGAGSGGSVYLTANSFSGNGVIRANGGTASGGGGGGSGGRAALYFETNLFAGPVSAWGGNGQQRGAAGSLFRRRVSEQLGEVTFDNGGVTGATTEFKNDNLLNSHVRVTGAALVGPPAGHRGLEFNITGNCTVEAGGKISATGRGYTGNNGVAPGRPGPPGGGGGYGGSGGAGNGGNSTGGASYGIVNMPADLGSGGGGTDAGAGGGAMQIVVQGTFRVDGEVSANGLGSTTGGGGAGGSLYLIAPSLTGAGTISARGGVGSAQAGGGAGGRIAVYLGTVAGYTNFNVDGGAGFIGGNAGSLFFGTYPAAP